MAENVKKSDIAILQDTVSDSESQKAILEEILQSIDFEGSAQSCSSAPPLKRTRSQGTLSKFSQNVRDANAIARSFFFQPHSTNKEKSQPPPPLPPIPQTQSNLQTPPPLPPLPCLASLQYSLNKSAWMSAAERKKDKKVDAAENKEGSEEKKANRNIAKPVFIKCRSVPSFSTSKEVTKETVVHNIWALGHSVRQRYYKNIAYNEIGDSLISVANTIDTGSSDGNIVVRLLSALAQRYQRVDKRLTADIWLLVADYYEFVLQNHCEAAYALDKACEFIENDSRKAVLLLENSKRLYELDMRYDQALRIEQKLEGYDMSVDWVAKSRERQKELRKKL